MGSGTVSGHGDGAAAADMGCPAEAGSKEVLAEEGKDEQDATVESSSLSASPAKQPMAPPPTVSVPAHESDSESDSAASSSESDEVMADLLSRMRDMLGTSRRDSESGLPAPPPSRLASLDVAGVADLILSGKAKNIVVMCGAGMSVSAGIPDFRTPGTGLYARLAEYKLPHPQAIFEIDYFRRTPQPFFHLARHLFPGTYLPTPAHHFLVLLHAKGLLTRIYTQNIDSLEVQAGLPSSVVVPAHGNFDSARCIDCRAPHEVQHVRDAVFGEEDGVARCSNKNCNGLVKPDIVMFGEDLPKRFFELLKVDFPKADLLIVLGTSLIVHPFASLIDHVKLDVPRVLINREVVGEPDAALRRAGYAKGFDFSSPQRHRDVLMLGDCDDGCRELARLLNWEADLDARIAAAARHWRKEKPDEAAEAAA
ncbi:Sir2 family protein [Helicosporidium sp. ATCC 50920]|nr:Sir2 family protein [Helicosporidium sp. ATCC 50920]|eukprot:KDD76014.1 Sir2 family protein [Helicosporidium sp. ATCC 50920]